jgi:outer membrane protein assembly factor BamB
MTYVPDQVGNYSIVFSWPGQTLTNGTGIPDNVGVPFVGDYFQPATSAPAMLTVIQTQVAQWQEPQLPTGYWERPINDANRGWSTLASNWLGGSWLIGNFQNEGQAPNSPHIMWTKPIVSGGIADAQWSGNLYDTDDYENPWTTPIVMNGMIFYNTGIYPKYGYYCLDLRTGQQLWYKNGTDNGLSNSVVLAQISGGGGSGPALTQTFPLLSFGQLYHYYSINGQGVLSYLWIVQGSSWYMLDSNTGNWILTLKNVPGGTAVVDQDGSLLRYSYSASTGRLLCWNSSQSIPPGGPTGTSQQQWKPMVGATIDAVNDTIWTQYGPSNAINSAGMSSWYASDIVPRSGYTMNLTVQKSLPGSISRVLQDDNRVPKTIFGSYFGSYEGLQGGSNIDSFSAWAIRIDYGAFPYSPYPNETYTQNNNLGYGSTLLWYKNITIPLSGNLTWSLGAVSYDDGVFTVQAKETMQRWGYSLTDGSLLWGPTAPQGSWDMYGMSNNLAYGTLYSTGYGGVLYAYNMSTGKLKWTYTASNVGYESPYGNYPLSVSAIADGKVYLHSTEHSPTIPLWRGSYLRCLDAFSGQELWKLLDFNMGLAVADGYIVTGNKYDNQMYVIGRGQSATTVSATPGLEHVITIQGTVTDQSPGQTWLGIPAAGTPAIADQFMQSWMEYLYEQQAKPTNAFGVVVHLTAVDPNGNYQDIGNVTSDITGHYGLMWTPPVPGYYTFTATFAGSNSYYGSSAETGLGVGQAAAPAASVVTPVPTQAPTAAITPTVAPTATIAQTPSPVVIPPTSAVPTATYIAIGVAAVVVIAVAAALVLRRRK